MGYIDAARRKFSGVPQEGENAEDICKLVNALIDAENASIRLWEATMIRDGEDRTPLDSKEEEFFENLNSHLVKDRFLLTQEQFDSLTHSQKFSAARVMARNVPPEGVFLTDHLGIRFPHIYIGIEEDGYAHS
jgi:hypothetical protein